MKQFHQDPSTGLRSVEYVLGQFDPQISSYEPNLEQKFISQKYVQGTPCDLTGKPRSVEIRFLCNEKQNGMTYVGELSEPATCEYSLSILTPLICEFTGMKVRKTLIPSIRCKGSSQPQE